ncbi:acyl-CoA dehydrogenase family protein [Kitasatospora sp. NPDC094015]|uniref:acyl-CoA dehydrogenase family protein n=1 Tax=Kitasatospora sp. NPDC094015 TaxID=3155205 RepID=UPI00331B80DC
MTAPLTTRPPAPAAARSDDFRAEVRTFLASPEVREELRRFSDLPAGREPGHLEVFRLLGERGWLAANWPVEYGGLGLRAVDAATVAEELGLAGVPDVAHVLSVDIVGLFLLMAGTDEQKARHLPPLARGERLATVLYSEPGVGSDLGSLRTTAEREGERWRVTGRKIYSQKSQFASQALCAARTCDGTGSGITLFLVDLTGPGVRVSPIWNATEERFDDVTLDVLVGDDDRIGPLHAGFAVLNTCLALERTGIDYQAKVRRWFDSVRDTAEQLGLLGDEALRQRLVALDTEILAGRLLAYQAVEAVDAGAVDPVVSARSKWFNTELARAVVELALDVAGLAGTATRWDGEPGWRETVEGIYRESPNLRLSAGTSEIMLKVVATLGLGLEG